jgi:hypothetical protein
MFTPGTSHRFCRSSQVVNTTTRGQPKSTVEIRAVDLRSAELSVLNDEEIF